MSQSSEQEPCFRVELNGAKISARKARLVVDMVRGLQVKRAQNILAVTHKKAATMLENLLNSALANATHQGVKDVSGYCVLEAYVNEKATRRRLRYRAQGKACLVRKRTCSIVLVIGER